ncbi:UvrD-helicase domain-containing protein [Streptomyces sp. NBC_00513]|uniref:UvrD-helicase domain-containing protein n=1 Tax=unclassified Streptomyces TaxID=2593676 RepID=UPI00224FEA08|nr:MULTISPECIES: UvrD-helicase domain-containing protein [unclassified Streptomyces]MCX5075467.1 UvrD-helicase domain-containing protein [Streptomyces sp. NBC_00424]MCX5152912.1 UvrD-helicase domain-containing protein [Streptomyces sp. NBC_00291]WUD41424.1 UvrD-helicase domain-containing protein [Streptomyces sp. NBC_00513]
MTGTYLSDAFATHKVEAMVKLFGLDPLDAEQWDFLQSETTQDLQAAPGSGKTTLIGLKLALMADAWTSATCGVCVLSHTNTAKKEIADRVASLAAGRSLLRYPHFIGTIQSFVHTFLALPAVRAKGVEVRSVDDAAFETAAIRLLQHSNYSALRSYVERQRDGSGIVTGATFAYKGGELVVTGATREPPFRAETNSGKQFSSLKWTLARRGVFRYLDMYAIAQQYLAEHPGIVPAVCARFPFVLLDEMQDTSAAQHELLDLIFASSPTVVQRVGDTNQGIYSDADAVSGPASFPLSGAAELPVSRRFGPQIAAVASRLAVRRPQQVHGAGPDGRVAVLLFDEATATDVVPTFERMAAVIVPEDVLLRRPPRVLGARQGRGGSQAYPQSISCYVPGYTPPGRPTAHRALIDAARAAGAQWRSGADSHEVSTELWNALRASFAPLTGEGLPALGRLERSGATPGGRVRILLRELLVYGAAFDEAGWGMITEQLTVQMKLLADRPLKAVGLEFTPAAEAAAAAGGVPRSSAAVPAVRSVPGTIQSAKGETHAATLILECLEKNGKKFDVTEALRIVAEGSDPQRELKSVQAAVQLVFVGATRPTHLLVLAAHRDRGKRYAEVMIDAGWDVRDLAEH